jgi:hypothetical protein
VEAMESIPVACDWLESEATKLRSGVKLPGSEDGPLEALSALRVVRARIDQVEELLSRALQLRAEQRRHLRVASAVVEEAWSARVTSQNPIRGVWGETAPRERYAVADIATIEERRKERIEREMYDRLDTLVEILKLRHTGLDGCRRDLHVVLRGMEVGRALER